MHHNRRQPLLGIGVVSKNVVDAAIQISNQFEVPLILVASRRQVEAAEFGGGYAHSWSTETFARYVRARDSGKKVWIGRDHGGPWQGRAPSGPTNGLAFEMDCAKRSFEVDIESGFDFLHIDSSLNPDETGGLSVLKRCFELYSHCCRYSRDRRSAVSFEVGTEDQGESVHDPEELEYLLVRLIEFCEGEELQHPTFIVAQTGTKVLNGVNTGVLGRVTQGSPDFRRVLVRIAENLRVCEKFGVSLKAHNADFLKSEALQGLRQLGIHAANVAPEFATAETEAFLEAATEVNETRVKESFISFVAQSGLWEKWTDVPIEMSDLQKARMAGHYLYSTDEFQEMKAVVSRKFLRLGMDLDSFIQLKVRKSILRYLLVFGFFESGVVDLPSIAEATR